MTFLRALQQSGGRREGANLNILNGKDVLLFSGCISKISQDLLQGVHLHREDGTAYRNNAASRLIMRRLKMVIFLSYGHIKGQKVKPLGINGSLLGFFHAYVLHHTDTNWAI